MLGVAARLSGAAGLGGRGLGRGARTMATATMEALAHVGGAQERLDRNRDGTKRLSFSIVGPGELETVNQLLYATYHPYEPLTNHLGLCTGINSLKDVDKMVEDKLTKNLTLVAYDESGRPVGAAVNNCVWRSEPTVDLEEELQGLQDPRYGPIQGIYEEIIADKMFDIGMIGVEVSSRGQGVATNLIRRSILLAGCLGFRAIKAEATGRFARNTFATVGMQPGSSIQYSDFEYQGEKVFAGVD